MPAGSHLALVVVVTLACPLGLGAVRTAPRSTLGTSRRHAAIVTMREDLGATPTALPEEEERQAMDLVGAFAEKVSDDGEEEGGERAPLSNSAGEHEAGSPFTSN